MQYVIKTKFLVQFLKQFGYIFFIQFHEIINQYLVNIILIPANDDLFFQKCYDNNFNLYRFYCWISKHIAAEVLSLLLSCWADREICCTCARRHSHKNCWSGDMFCWRNVRTDRSCGSLQCVKEHKQNEAHRTHSKETVEPADEDDDSRKQKYFSRHPTPYRTNINNVYI